MDRELKATFCLPVNGEVADKSGRKCAIGDRNVKSLDLGPEPTD